MVRRGGFYRVRVTLLLTLLAAVSLWACYDVNARKARNHWSAPLRVALVVLQHGQVDPGAILSLIARTPALEQRLSAEHARYQPDGHPRVIEFVPYGPVQVASLPPSDPGTTLWDRLGHAYALFRYTHAVDRAAGVSTLSFDSRIYVVVEPARDPGELQVEGFSENGGRVGVTRVELDTTNVDLALFVATHELFHTLGATDKYDASGRSLLPSGLAEPDRVPLYPQPGAEIMARNRVISPSYELVPETLDELVVGRVTAREIGWVD
jgi:hypothetical protein